MHAYWARGAIIEWERANASAPPSTAEYMELLSRFDVRVQHWWANPPGVGTVTGAGGVPSGEAFGTPTVTRVSVASVAGAGGIPSSEAFGIPTVSRLAVASLAGVGGIPSGILFGTFATDAEIPIPVSTLIVEDGTAKEDAESYISVADADAYFQARGVTTWAALTMDAKDAALRLATDYMVGAYRMRWAGRRKTSTQRLDWPRYEVPMLDGPGYYAGYPNYYDDDAVPSEVRLACAELALRAASGPLVGDVGQLTKSVTVGPITKVYADGSMPVQRYLAVDRMVAPLLKGGGSGQISVVRC